jgi:hypothetical protein
LPTRSLLQAAFYFRTNGCYCFNEAATPDVISCATARYKVYYHDAPATASGVARRELARGRRASRVDTSLCPIGLTACRIEDSADGYEVRSFRSQACYRCDSRDLTLFLLLFSPALSPAHLPSQCLDTLTELESCGGCRNGVFSATLAPAAHTIGQQRLGRVDRLCVTLPLFAIPRFH